MPLCESEKEIVKKETSPDDVDLIEVVNILQNKLAASGHTLEINLPQIVVVGCQSAGKSSVLENIVGREFLPRGSGVVTRRPTVVQLEPSKEEYTVFLHQPDRKIRDFQQVKEEIQNETLRDPGPVGFSSKPISLKIFSPNVLKLTLVDLPGLIKVALDYQSEDSIKEIRNMVLEYISQPNSLILAVSPANQDIANSDALEIAKTVDPKRLRTIGVLTKLDLMDAGTNAKDVLENKKIPLKRGFIGVINRSQKDIEEECDFDYCLEKEKNFFETTFCYRQLADKMGTPYLKKYLNKQLHDHIKESLPGVRQEITQKMTCFRKMLRNFKSDIGNNATNTLGTRFYMIKLVQNYIEALKTEIFGYSEQVTMQQLSAGSMISYKLYANAEKCLTMPKIPEKAELLKIIANLHGIRNSLTLPSLALEVVASQLISQFIPPLNQLVDSIADTVISQVERTTNMLDSYPNLKNEVAYLITKTIHDAAENTKDSLEKHLEAEMYFVNTYRQDFKFPKPKKGETYFPMKLWNNRKPKSISSDNKNDSDSDEEDSVVNMNGNNLDARDSSFNINYNNLDARDSSINIKGKDSSININNDSILDEEEEAAESLALNGSAKKNVEYLANIIEKYMIVQKKHVEDTAIKYILYFLVKNVMDFVKCGLLPTILESETESIAKDCKKDFEKMASVESTCKTLEDALKAIQNF